MAKRGRKPAAQINPPFWAAEVFFLTTEDRQTVKSALKLATYQTTYLSKAIQRSKALTAICKEYLTVHAPNKILNKQNLLSNGRTNNYLTALQTRYDRQNAKNRPPTKSEQHQAKLLNAAYDRRFPAEKQKNSLPETREIHTDQTEP